MPDRYLPVIPVRDDDDVVYEILETYYFIQMYYFYDG